MNNLISVIIPTFNRKYKLQRALKNLLAQTYNLWEAIIVDNNSKDGTLDMIKKINDPRIKCYQINNNGIIASSRNLAIKKASGNILAFLDSDDWWTKEKLYFSNLYFNKGYKFLYHDMRIRKKNLIFDRKLSYCRQLKNDQFQDLKLNGPAFATSSVVVDKDLFSKCNFFDEDKIYIAWEDYDAWLRVSKNYNNFYKIDKTLGYVNIDNENYLDANKSILNLNEFLRKYIFDEKIPNWVSYNLIKSNFLLKKFSYVKDNFDKIEFNKLNINQKLYYIYISVRILIKK